MLLVRPGVKETQTIYAETKNVASTKEERIRCTESPPMNIIHRCSNRSGVLANEGGGEDGLYMRGNLERAVAMLTRVLLPFPWRWKKTLL